MHDTSISLTLASLDDTAQLAERFASLLETGDVLLLEGDIGMGKSFFARTLIQSAQDDPEDVPSPTFTIVQTYDSRLGEIWHTDLYRLGGPDDIIELGLLEAFDTAICLVEWPDKLQDLAPKSALTLSLSQGSREDARDVDLRWSDPKWDNRLKAVIHA